MLAGRVALVVATTEASRAIGGGRSTRMCPSALGRNGAVLAIRQFEFEALCASLIPIGSVRRLLMT